MGWLEGHGFALQAKAMAKTGDGYIRTYKYLSELVYQISTATSLKPLGIFLRKIGHY